MRFSDAFPTNVTQTMGSYTFDEASIIAFAKKFDPQYFHVDPVRAADSVLGGLCASGWHVCSAWMQLNVAFLGRHFREMAASGVKPPVMGPALGFRDLKWKAPVYAGDTVTYSVTLLRSVKAPNRDDRYLNEVLCEGVNQDGKPVVSFTVTVIDFG